MFNNFISYLLRETLSSKGFTRSKKKGLIIKKFDHGTCRFYFHENRKHNLSSLKYGIRFDYVEEYIDQFFERKTDFIASTVFIGLHSLLLDSDLSKFHFSSKQEIALSSEIINSHYNNFIRDYFDQYSNYLGLNSLLCESNFDPVKFRNKYYHNETLHGFIRSILVRSIIGGEIKDLILFHKEFFKDTNYHDRYLALYTKFIKYLRENPPSLQINQKNS